MRILPHLLLLPFPAQAACQGLDLLSCPIAGSQKHLEICLDGDHRTYAFGPRGQPELTLSEPLSAGTYLPWQGVGRAVHEEVEFRNQGYSYIVGWSMDRLDEGHPISGGVTIFEGTRYVATLDCAAGSLGESFEPVLSDAMRGIGLCWDFSAHGWSGAACG
jgi:hypothetical protein